MIQVLLIQARSCTFPINSNSGLVAALTISSRVLVSRSTSRLLTTMAGVVKKNNTMNKKLLMRNERKYQNRERIARFCLQVKVQQLESDKHTALRIA